MPMRRTACSMTRWPVLGSRLVKVKHFAAWSAAPWRNSVQHCGFGHGYTGVQCSRFLKRAFFADWHGLLFQHIGISMCTCMPARLRAWAAAFPHASSAYLHVHTYWSQKINPHPEMSSAFLSGHTRSLFPYEIVALWCLGANTQDPHADITRLRYILHFKTTSCRESGMCVC